MADALDPCALFSVEDRVAIVSGASSGLGARFARVLHAAGANVVAAARRVDRLEALAEELPGLVPVRCDVTSAEDRAALVQTALERFDRVDILVNNAGVTETQVPSEDQDLDDFRAVLDVNLVALYGLSQLCAKPMLERGAGSIVNIASVLGFISSSPMKQPAYVASKAAVVNLTRELGAQWARRGVRVNGIAPGWFRSEMTAETMFDDARGHDFIVRNAPIGRPGEEDELDGALLFLASDASRYVVGQTVLVDGGWTLR